MQKAQPVPPKEDKKLVAALKKLGTVNEQGVEEVNMFREDGKVVHFGAPKGKVNCYIREEGGREDGEGGDRK